MSPVELPAESIGGVFRTVVTDVALVVDEQGGPAVVDVELTLTSVKMSKSGIPLISRKTKESELQIRLATRVMKTD